MVRRASSAALAALVLGAASLIPGPVAAGAGGRAPARSGPRRAVPGEVVVRYRRGVDRSDRAAIRRAADVRLEERLPLPRLELVETSTGRGVAKAVAELEDLPGVAYAEPNFRYRIDADPDDPMFDEQWALDRIDAPEAWDAGQGSPGVVVAVLDTGVEYEHPDVIGNRWENPGEVLADGLDNDGNGFIDDRYGWDFVGEDSIPRDAHGHGTHVAGILGAQGNNTTGVTGVNWDVSIMSLRVCDASGSCSTADVVEAIEYAGEMGAVAANMSFSGGSFSQAQKDAIDAAPGTLFVASAGNAGTNNDVAPQYPCNYPSANLLCVAASTEADGRWANSNFGATSVDLAAPGAETAGPGVLSTIAEFETLFSDNFEGMTPNWDFVDLGIDDPDAWERTTEHSESPTQSITDSVGVPYADDANVAVTVGAPWNLSGRFGGSVAYELRLQTEAGADWLRVEEAYGG